MPREEQAVYLTFDDGPIPEVTPWVLDQLAEHGAKATFFCIGSNARSYPTILQRILVEGHAVGNHTWDHRQGWGCPDRAYFRSVLEARQWLNTDLFRPPLRQDHPFSGLGAQQPFPGGDVGCAQRGLRYPYRWSALHPERLG
jgi:peptidoglycan/xylan/chitin deacetylase (PgdA/CDA1 family)